MSIPLVDLAAQHAEVAAEVEAGLTDVFATTAFIGGKAVGEFELAYADFTQVAHCVGVANGTDALELALRGVGVRPGGEVIVPANTFIATAEAVSRIGAIPVLVDVDPDYLLIDPNQVAAATTKRADVAEKVRLIANHGSSRKYVHDVVGVNSRLDTIQAVVLKAKLARLPEWNERRRAAAARYGELLADVPGVRTPQSAPGNVDVWHLYVVRVPNRDAVLQALHEA